MTTLGMLIVVGWVLTGSVGATITWLYFYNRFPTIRDRTDILLPIVTFIIGPIGLLASIIAITMLRGWSYIHKPTE